MIKAIAESSTLKMVVASLGVLNYQWLSGNIDATLTEYATATMLIVGPWIAREWRKAHYDK